MEEKDSERLCSPSFVLKRLVCDNTKRCEVLLNDAPFTCCSNEQTKLRRNKNSVSLLRPLFYRANSPEDSCEHKLMLTWETPSLGRTQKNLQIRNQNLKAEGKMGVFKDQSRPGGLQGHGKSQGPAYLNWLCPSATSFLFTGSS